MSKDIAYTWALALFMAVFAIRTTNHVGSVWDALTLYGVFTLVAVIIQLFKQRAMHNE